MQNPNDDRAELIELLARYASMPDTKDWDDMFDTVFAETVRWDLSSVTGAPAVELARDTLRELLRSAFRAYSATHHAVTNHRVRVEGEQARVRAHIRAEHWLPPELAGPGPSRWLVVGFYDDVAIRTPQGWRLSSVRLIVTHQENSEVAAIARAEAKRNRSA